MASVQAWSIKKRWASKFEEFLRTSSACHLAVSLIRGDCVYWWIREFVVSVFLCHEQIYKGLGWKLNK